LSELDESRTQRLEVAGEGFGLWSVEGSDVSSGSMSACFRKSARPYLATKRAMSL
jgi:hypothetical protein